MRMAKININKFMCELPTSVGVASKQGVFFFKHRIVMHRKPVIVCQSDGVCIAYISSIVVRLLRT